MARRGRLSAWTEGAPGDKAKEGREKKRKKEKNCERTFDDARTGSPADHGRARACPRASLHPRLRGYGAHSPRGPNTTNTQSWKVSKCGGRNLLRAAITPTSLPGQTRWTLKQVQAALSPTGLAFLE